MNIVYYSSLFFTDCDFPLIRAFQNKGNNVLYFIELISGKTKGALFNIKTALPLHGIVKAEEIEEFKVYSEYLDLKNIFIVVRTNQLWNLKNWITYYRLCLMIKAFRPAVFHSTLILGISESLLYLFKKKMVLTVHDPFVHSGETSRLLEIKRKIAFKFVPKFVLLNRKQSKPFSKTYNISSHRIYLNSLGIYDCLNYLSNRQGKTTLLPQKYILFFGHFSPYKGIDVLCESMKLVHKKIPDLSCIIAGNGKLNFDYAPYKNLNYITLINQYIELSDLSSLISNSLFVVCPYKDATQSGVVFSSFAMAKPVVATNVGGMSETIIDGKTGILCPPNNVEALSESIVLLYSDSELLKELGKNISKSYAKGEVSWDSIAETYIHCYNN